MHNLNKLKKKNSFASSLFFRKSVEIGIVFLSFFFNFAALCVIITLAPDSVICALASLVMPISDPLDRFFYPHHTPMKDIYNLSLLYHTKTRFSHTEADNFFRIRKKCKNIGSEPAAPKSPSTSKMAGTSKTRPKTASTPKGNYDLILV